MMKDYNNLGLDDLDIMDLDEDETGVLDIDDTDIEETGSETTDSDEMTVEDSEEFIMEEPYVVPVVENFDEQDDAEDFIEEYDDSEEAFGGSKPDKEEKDKKAAVPMGGFLERLIHMDTMDKIIAGLGCVVLVMAIVALSIFMSYRSSEGQLLTFADSGKNLENITLIGESGLLAVTDATMAKIDAQNAALEEEEEEEEKDDNISSIVVKTNFTSIQKDLKVKFTNKRTGKLLAGIPFVIELVSPSGKTLEWTDEDKDGIIYYKNIEAGKYNVTLKELEGEIYERYIMDTTTQTVTVKKEIAYEKVDVSDEILDESEIDASKEDTELGNTVESVLTDTVVWVASKKEAGGKDYVEVKKADIVAPAATSRNLGQSSHYVMMMISQEEVAVTLDKASAELEKGQTLDLVATVTGNADVTVTWTSSNDAVATVDANGKVTGVAEGSANITATSQAEPNKSATCNITVKAASVTSSITLDKSTAEVEIGKDITLKATTVPTDGVTVKWTSSNAEIATVDNGKVTGIKEGEATITATLVENGNETVKSTCVVTVKKAARTIALDNTKLEMAVGEEKTLKATVEGYTTDSNGKVTWTTSDKTIATVDDNGKVLALKAGSVKITATNTEKDVKVEAVCEITVKEAAGLKTKAGLDVYVLKGDKYVKATAADYEKNDVKFYIYTDVYKYQGWQTIDGKTYYYTADNKKVTGEQVIMGAKYVFDKDGVLTSSTGVMGIDVSKWNGTIDWSQVKASGVNYVIIRCGYRGSSKGALIEDPKYKANIEGATKAGLKVGVYFFSQAIDEVEAVQEASMVLSLVKNYKISYPIFLDVEASGGRADNISKETRTAVCKAFCQTIQNSGYTAGIYANKTWLTSKIDTSQLGSYKIWLAQYAAAPTYTGRYEIWQYKDSGSVPGISGHVDLNLSYLGY